MHVSNRRSPLLIVSVLALGGLLVSCSGPTGSTATQGSSNAGVLTVDQVFMMPSVDPYALTQTDQWEDVYAMYDPLTLSNDKGQLENILAKDWKNEDPLNWVLTLKSGMKWSDGSPITADDVKFSIERMKDPATKSIWGPAYTYIQSTQVLDGTSIRITTARPIAELPRDFGRMVMMPKVAFEKVGLQEFLKAPVTSGPFLFKSMVPGSSLTLVKNPNYHAGVVKLDTLIFREVPNASTRVADVLSGQADIAMAVSPSDMKQVNSSSNAKIISTESIQRIKLEFMMKTDPRLQNEKVRQAVIRAIDPKALNKSLFQGTAGLPTGWMNSLTDGYCPVPLPSYDPTAAKELLKEAGYPNGFPLDLNGLTPSYTLSDQVEPAIADMMSKAGFTVTQNVNESAKDADLYNNGRMTGLRIWGIANTSGGADQMLRNSDINRSSRAMVDPTLQALIQQQQSEFDTSKRRAVVCDINKRVVDASLEMSVLSLPNISAVSKSVSGFTPSPYLLQRYNTVVKH
ncbi:ABC transporter substrate-binding protein [Microbacterium capsulatum]|uniref:ABC transporter substrate-binding protein n=1 Tax=Microbacterium capsulatum TaxID=3041921 RepID=A0ABU0XDE1_9MICO|nr:ABC transporter substrate-binding protein [Microbacterium sp. ASV81]MDQ4213081.1 ABC transporter substrate-binding protein [Microbacterium sp. ASV81]